MFTPPTFLKGPLSFWREVGIKNPEKIVCIQKNGQPEDAAGKKTIRIENDTEKISCLDTGGETFTLF